MKWIALSIILLTIFGGSILLWPLLNQSNTPESALIKPTPYTSPYVTNLGGSENNIKDTQNLNSPKQNNTDVLRTTYREPLRTDNAAQVIDEIMTDDYFIAPDPGYDRRTMEQLFFDEINRIRLINGLSTLRYRKDLGRVARKHSEDQVAQAFKEKNTAGILLSTPVIRHDGTLFGATHVDRLREKDIYNYGVVGENILSTFLFDNRVLSDNATNILSVSWRSPEEIVETGVRDWMLSPGHRKNILIPQYTHTGLGFVRADDFLIVTQLFIEEVDCGYYNGNCCQDGGSDVYSCYNNYTCSEKSNGDRECK